MEIKKTEVIYPTVDDRLQDYGLPYLIDSVDQWEWVKWICTDGSGFTDGCSMEIFLRRFYWNGCKWIRE